MQSQEEVTYWQKWCELRLLRWGVAVSLVICGIILSQRIKICEEDLAQIGDTSVVEVCRSPKVTDPISLAVGLLTVLFLLPDVSEVSIGSLISLKRTVDETVKRQGEMGEEIKSLKLSLQLSQIQSQIQSQKQSVQVVNNFGKAQVLPTPSYVTPAASVELRPDSTIEDLLAPLRDQSVYKNTRIIDALKLVELRPSKPVRVASVGVAAAQQLFDNKVLSSQLETPFTARSTSGWPVANSIIGHVLTMAPTAKIFQLGVLDETGVLKQVGDLQAAVEKAIAWKPDILVIDLGSPENQSILISELLTKASEEMLILAPAGNDHQDVATWPARLPNVLAITALDSSERLAPFSNYGLSVDLAVESVDVLCLTGVKPDGGPEFGKMSGTAISSHLVAGIASMLISKTEIQPREIRQLLIENARTLEEDPSLKLVDALSAMQSALAIPD